MIQLHHLNNSRSQRILWMLEEMGVEYEIKTYQRDSETNLAPTTLKLIHPLGKSPVVTDGEATVAESGAIIEYLAQAYAPQFIPEHGSEAHRQYTYWLHFAEGTLMPPMVAKLVFDKVREKAKPFFVKFIANQIAEKVMSAYFGPNIQANLSFIDNHLKNNEWFAGEQLSGADFQMSFPLEASVMRGAAAPYENIRRFVEKVHARDAYKRALEKGGKYDYA